MKITQFTQTHKNQGVEENDWVKWKYLKGVREKVLCKQKGRQKENGLFGEGKRGFSRSTNVCGYLGALQEVLPCRKYG